MIIKTDKETRSRMEWLLRMQIANNVDEGVKHWLRKEIDLTMWDMIVTDTDDLIGVAHLIDMDEIGAAFEKACLLDTAVRDIIPTEVWNWMSMVRAQEKVA